MDPVIDATVRAGLALLFLVAAGHKLRAPLRFRSTLAEYRVLPAVAVPVAAWVVPGVEAGVAGALVLSRAEGLLGAALLLAVYGLAIGANLARGRRDLDCGCGGPAARRPISGWLVARNALLAVAALAVAGPVPARPLVWVDSVTLVAATAALAALYAASDRLLAQAPAFARLRSAR